MKVFDNAMVVHRNESFTIDKEILNRDDSPYIVSSRMRNPYFLLTVSSSIYHDDNAYALNCWLDLSDALRFHSTNAVNLKEFQDSLADEEYEVTSWNDITTIPSGYEGDNPSYANESVFYLETDTGVEYKYWKYSTTDHTTGNYNGEWTDYKCDIKYSFTKDETSQWIEQTYYYSILLVDGQSMTIYLSDLAGKNDIDVTDIVNDNYKMYDRLYDNGVDVSDINPGRMLAKYTTVITILEPTKISVLSNLKGEM